ncbi:MAG: CopG family transcriptional regulator [Desulfobaccales bacterium]
MKKVTIYLDDQLAQWTRIRAAGRHTSVSGLVGELLKERMREEDDYRLAMEQFLAQEPRVLREPGTRYPKREELYDR